jgi:thiol-disulfide isomerase/thioredoxin
MRLSKITIIFIFFLSLVGLAQATEKKTFSQEAFSVSQAANDSIIVYIFAPWCTTCKKQEAVIEKIIQDPRFDKIRYFVVDFDNDKETMRKLKANTRSTILVYKGPREITRSANDTDPASLQSLLEKAL